LPHDYARTSLLLKVESFLLVHAFVDADIIPTGIKDDSSFMPVGIARGDGGAAARNKRLLYRRSFPMTVGISQCDFSLR